MGITCSINPTLPGQEHCIHLSDCGSSCTKLEWRTLLLEGAEVIMKTCLSRSRGFPVRSNRFGRVGKKNRSGGLKMDVLSKLRGFTGQHQKY